MKEKVCRICGGNFMPMKNGNNRQFCFDCVPLKEEGEDPTSAKRKAIKIEGVKRLGGSCLKCGESRIHVLHFHHKDPSLKLETPSVYARNGNVTRFFIEIQKCILLCANCHADFHWLSSNDGITLEEYLGQVENLDFSFSSDWETSYSTIKKEKLCPNCKNNFILTDSSLCTSCHGIKNRVVERPSAQILEEELKNSNFTQVGKMYGVSDNAIRKWCKSYGMSTKSADYKN